MPAKILNAFKDENPELRKQFGCMTGILQMFDRNRLLSGRRLNDHSHKKNPSGQALSSSRGYREVYNSSSQQNGLNENRRVSIDSSRVSCSSSSSSSSSSFFDCNKSMQQDAAPFDRAIFQEQSLKCSLNFKAHESDAKSNPPSGCQTATMQNGQQCHDLRKVVKESMQRDSKILPAIKTLTWEEERDEAAKQRNSPRPPFLSKAAGGTCATGVHNKPRARPEDLKESIRVVLKLKQAPLSFSEYATKDSSYRVARESPRFSCDGREFSRRLIDSRDDSKAIAAKLRDLPRLSLGSREGSLRSSNLVSRANTLMEDLNRTTSATTTTATPRLSNASSLHEDPGSNKRPPGLVAKLMGLEELPDGWSSTAEESITKQTNGSFTSSPSLSARSLKSARAMKENVVWDSPRISIKDSPVPETKGRVPSAKQRIATEAAPWIQQERGRVDRRTAVGCPEAVTNKQRSASVYSEIVKKLEELQFQQSNKDLRALKQILDLMHPKASLDATKDDAQQPWTPTQGYSRDQNPGRKHLTKSSNSPRALEPAKSVGKSGVPPLCSTGSQSGLPRLRTGGACDRSKGTATSKTDKDQSPRVSPRLPNPAQSLTRHQHSVRDDCGRSSAANSCSVSPKVLQRRADAEKKHSLPNASSEFSKAQKLSTNKHQVESVSPRGKITLKQSQIQKMADKASGSSNEAMIQKMAETKSALLQRGLRSPSSRPVSSTVTSFLNQKNSSRILSEYTANKEVTSSAFDQASPVSVLDSSCFQDLLPTSPLGRSWNQKDNETIDCNYRCFTASPDSKPSKSSPEEAITPKRTGAVVDFVREDRKSNGMVNPDHKYVTEMLLATGLLREEDLSIGSKCRLPVQSHSSGQAINPDLFYVLEQLRGTKTRPGSEKSRRKLVFDVANEILAQKLELSAYDNDLQLLIQGGKTSGRCLLQEVCSDIDQLQAQCGGRSGSMLDDDRDAVSGEDILHETAGWTDFRAERHEMVLEIERLIFKDLISDIIRDLTLAPAIMTRLLCLNTTIRKKPRRRMNHTNSSDEMAANKLVVRDEGFDFQLETKS